MNWTAIASLIAALAAAASVLYTGRSLDATRAQNATADQSQLTDRFTKAVDQLDRGGPEHLQARLGAIYALERLAWDSSRDHPTIVEVLSAFIRTTTPQRLPEPTATATGTCPDQAVAADIQAALTVLGRRNTAQDRSTSRVDLHSACLRRADLDGARLRGAIFFNADLTNANLRRADLTDANLAATNLTETYLTSANLSGADLSRAVLISADGRGADFTDAALYSADCTTAIFFDATFTDAYIGAANLTRTYLSGADLSGANLVSAMLIDTQMHGANLTNARLINAELHEAFLGAADLTGVEHDDTTVVINVGIDAKTRGVWW